MAENKTLKKIRRHFHNKNNKNEYNLNEYNLNKPKFYLRFVDDILAAFGNEQDSLNVLDFLNKRHTNIKFTIEHHINHSIAFLDLFISGINNQNLTFQPMQDFS